MILEDLALLISDYSTSLFNGEYRVGKTVPFEHDKDGIVCIGTVECVDEGYYHVNPSEREGQRFHFSLSFLSINEMPDPGKKAELQSLLNAT